MAWNEPGGGSGKGGPSDGPPDLDEIFRQIKNNLVRLFSDKNASRSGGNGGWGSGSSQSSSGGPSLKSSLLVFLVGFLVFYVYWGITIIHPGFEGAMFRLGRYVETLGPGQHWVAPFFERIVSVNVGQVLTANVSAHQMLTGDENIVSVDVAVSYRIHNVREYVLQMVAPPRFLDLSVGALRGGLSSTMERTMEQVTDSAMRQVMGSSKLDEILTTGRSVIAQNIQKNVQQLVSQYQIGIQIENVNLQQISAPDEVKDAFDDVMRAREDQRTLENQARSYSKQVVPDAQGQATRMEAEARAYKEQVTLKAQGEVARFLKLQEEHQKSPNLVRQQLYLKTMESVLARSRKVLLDTAPGSVVYLGLQPAGPEEPSTTTSSSSAAAPLMLPSSALKTGGN